MMEKTAERNAQETIKTPIRISLIGPFEMMDADGNDITPSSMKNCALVAILCLAPNFKRTRSALAGMLWGDRATAQGQASLRQALALLRKVLKDNIIIDRRNVQLKPDAFNIDLVHDRERSIEAIQNGEVVLEGFDINDSEFESWLSDLRRWMFSEVLPEEESFHLVPHKFPGLIREG